MKIACVGMSHLGLVTAVSLAHKGHSVYAFDLDQNRIDALRNNKIEISEPGLFSSLSDNSSHITFTSNFDTLSQCDIVLIALDVVTNEKGESDYRALNSLIDRFVTFVGTSTPLIVMSQVQPGYTRSLTKKYGLEFIYQVETLVFGQALHRALNPERFIVGLPNWNDKLNKTYEAFLLSYSVPIFKMDFESAELSKIAINLYLASTLTTTNALAEICEFIGADWELIKPALRLDKRIGSHAYLTPGLGISGGNIERDISTALRFSDNLKGSKQVFESMRSHSANRKLWPSQVLRREFPRTKQRPKITVWGLAYKRNTHSIKNSPAIANIANLFTDYDLHVSDPLIKECPPYTNYVTYHDNPLSALENSNALLILTDWEIYSQFSSKQILENMENTIIIDPYGIASDGLSSFPKYFTLGRRENSEERLDHE